MEACVCDADGAQVIDKRNGDRCCFDQFVAVVGLCRCVTVVVLVVMMAIAMQWWACACSCPDFFTQWARYA